jgi:hypothetical protein
MGALVLSADANPGTASWQNPAVAITTLASGTAIPVTDSAAITFGLEAAGETNTLADPTFSGQTLSLFVGSFAPGASRVVTVNKAIDGLGNNTITFDAALDFILLYSQPTEFGFFWRVVVNDGCVLSNVP